MDPDGGVVEVGDLGSDPGRGPAREGDDDVGRADAVAPLRQAVDPPSNRDRLGLRVQGQLATGLDSPRVAGMAGVDEADDGHVGPRTLTQATSDVATGSTIAEDQESTAGPASEDRGRDRVGFAWGNLHRCPPIHRYRSRTHPWVDNS